MYVSATKLCMFLQPNYLCGGDALGKGKMEQSCLCQPPLPSPAATSYNESGWLRQRELLTSFLVRCLRKPLGSPALTRPGLPQVDYRWLRHIIVLFFLTQGSGSGMFYIRLRPSTAIGCGTKQ
jgi:hypothetical protein